LLKNIAYPNTVACKNDIKFSSFCATAVFLLSTARLLVLYKLAFWGSANWTTPVFRQLLEGCSRWHVVFWVSDFWVVYVAADAAFPLFHFLILFDKKSVESYKRLLWESTFLIFEFLRKQGKRVGG
jgi:hypothetical protein